MYFVKWSYTDELGRIDGWNTEWFDTMREAEDWIREKHKGNGSYFQYKPPRSGSYEHWLELLRLQDRLKELEKEFE